MKIIQSSPFNLLAYGLSLISYMTLMLSIPLIDTIADSLQVHVSQIHLGMSLLFFLFSLSAILFSILSDIFGAYTTLKFAQITSLFGLLLLANTHDITVFYLGCTLIGAGTGCYSPIGRALLLRHTNNPKAIKIFTSKISICVILAPILASILARGMAFFDWRYAYYCMFIIELTLLIVSQIILKNDRQQLLLIRNIKKTLWHCLSQKSFILNTLSTGVGYAVFMQTIMGNVHSILSQTRMLNYNEMNEIILGLSAVYIIGIFTFRKLINLDNLPLVRLLFVATFLCGSGLLFYSETHFLLSVIALYIISFTIGFLNPMSSSYAMANIKLGQGMASALLTFSFAFVSSLYSLAQANLMLSNEAFTLSAMFASFFFLLFIAISLVRYKFN
ncbi:MFS transporter [uncultured Shewanella sp.]|uniref:MFS transporter n=1 Tax=uncultured Shewanella sp. TaxID=173975 RepID=UPI00261BE64B|nr:MFS transporter [uncultured Shewanella sp.]